MTRREWLRLAASLPMVDAALRTARQASALSLAQLQRAPWRAISADDSPAPDAVQLTRTWADGLCRSERAVVVERSGCDRPQWSAERR